MPSREWLDRAGNRDRWNAYLRKRRTQAREGRPRERRSDTMQAQADALGVSTRTLYRRRASGTDPTAKLKSGPPPVQFDGPLLLPGETRQQACARLGISERTWFRRRKGEQPK